VTFTWPGTFEAYRDWLPVVVGWSPVTLLEGATPLVHAPTAVDDRLHWMRVKVYRVVCTVTGYGLKEAGGTALNGMPAVPNDTTAVASQ